MELEILRLIQNTPGTRYSVKEVGKIIDRQKFREDSIWARPYLERLVEQKLIFKDPDSLYFYEIPEEEEEIWKSRGTATGI